MSRRDAITYEMSKVRNTRPATIKGPREGDTPSYEKSGKIVERMVTKRVLSG